jgi:DNA-binding transcriptional ArsR family regulator
VVFYLECLAEAAEDGVASATRIFRLIERDCQALLADPATSVSAIRLFEHLPDHPMMTTTLAMDLLAVTKPTVMKSIAILEGAGILEETTGKQRDRVWGYARYLEELGRDGAVG